MRMSVIGVLLIFLGGFLGGCGARRMWTETLPYSYQPKASCWMCDLMGDPPTAQLYYPEGTHQRRNVFYVCPHGHVTRYGRTIEDGKLLFQQGTAKDWGVIFEDEGFRELIKRGH